MHHKGGNGGAAQTSTNGNGNAGAAPSGGGGGGRSNTATSSGGIGAAGQVVITYCINFSISSTSAATPICTSPGTSLVTLTSSAVGLPTGTYTVTYNSPAGTGLTAPMTVTTAGTGSFTATGLTTATTGTITVTNLASGTCSTPIGSGNVSNTITISQSPIITTTGTMGTICFNASQQTTSLAYSATIGSPTTYSIDWNAAANTAGLADQGNTPFTFAAGGGTLTGIIITGNTQSGSYSGTMSITNAAGCTITQAVTVAVNPPPIATAGGSQTICQNGSATVSGATASNGTILWTHNGSGSLSNATTTTPTYTAVAPDGGNTVTLTMTVTSNNACAPATATATYTVIVKATPTATAGGSQTICFSGTATVSGATSSNGTILWTHNGNGSLTNASTLTPTYTPGTGDQNTTVNLTLTVSNAPCTRLPLHIQ